MLGRGFFSIPVVLAGFFLLCSPFPAEAQQKITPSHVLQVADDVVGELTLLLEANFSDPTLPAPQEVKGKRPRHVIQKARQILIKVQLLKEVNGLPVADLEPIPVREIKPADVKGWVEKVLAAVRELRGPYKITAMPDPAPLGEKKTPSDVFQRLTQVGSMVDRLDLPATVPNDVYRVSLSLVDDIRLVAQAVGFTDKIDWKGRKSAGKTPANVYQESYFLLKDMKKLIGAAPSLAIPGGIVLPPEKTGKITPGDVIDIQNTLLAELSSLKTKLGVTQPTKVFPPQVAKTPSDVYVAVKAAGEYTLRATLAASMAATAN
jgi:hypothetical protein